MTCVAVVTPRPTGHGQSSDLPGDGIERTHADDRHRPRARQTNTERDADPKARVGAGAYTDTHRLGRLSRCCRQGACEDVVDHFYMPPRSLDGDHRSRTVRVCKTNGRCRP